MREQDTTSIITNNYTITSLQINLVSAFPKCGPPPFSFIITGDRNDLVPFRIRQFWFHLINPSLKTNISSIPMVLSWLAKNAEFEIIKENISQYRWILYQFIVLKSYVQQIKWYESFLRQIKKSGNSSWKHFKRLNSAILPKFVLSCYL